MFLDDFTDLMNQEADVTRFETTYNAATGKKSKSWVALETLQGMFYTKKDLEKYFKGDHYSPSIVGAFGTFPGASATKDDRIAINGITYGIDSTDNIARQDEVLLIILKEFN